MYIIPLIRTGRAISACYLFPIEPLYAITISETITYIIPIIKKSILDKDTLLYMFYFIFDYNKSIDLIEKYRKERKVYYNFELFSITLFLIYNYMQNI
tara:strand:- start:93 stop:386 length:294 start_codon:yes stop_codon:yes gene_type:complete